MGYGFSWWIYDLMDYFGLLNKLESYEKNYRVYEIGKTKLNRKIFAVEKFLSEDFFTAIFVASIHGREYITTDLLCKFLDEDLFKNINEFNFSFILMANPDGVELSKHGLESIFNENYKEKLFKINNSNFDFSLWKANACGIDLNNNFNANFGDNSFKTSPSSQGYPGKSFESELETQAIINYIKQKKTFFCISYHSKGEEIYYNFFQEGQNLIRDSVIAKRFAESTGYLIRNVESISSGGLKDWCIKSLKIPALTIEIGNDNLLHPINEKLIDEIYQKNKMVAFDLKFAYNIFKEFERKNAK